MTMFQSDLIPQTSYSLGDRGLDFGLETDFDLLARTTHQFVGVVLVECCSLRIVFHLAAGLTER